MTTRIKHLLALSALCGLALGGGCGPESLPKPADPDPALRSNPADGITQQTSLKGEIGLGAKITAAFDESSYHMYFVKLEKDQSIRISLGGAEGDLDTVLRVYGPESAGSGLGEKRLAYDDDSGEGGGSLIESFTAAVAGQYAIVASTYGGAPAAGVEYTLETSCPGGTCAAPQRTAWTIDIELDCLGTKCSSFTETSRQRIVQTYEQLGIKLVFHPDEELPENTYGDVFEYMSMKKAYTEHFQHRGQAGWHYLVFSGVILEASMGGWGRLGGDMAVIGNEWLRYEPGERLEAELVYIFLHEFGHNMGLTHEGFDPDHPHDYNDCVMPSAAGRSRADMPATTYCHSCEEHINPATKPAW